MRDVASSQLVPRVRGTNRQTDRRTHWAAPLNWTQEQEPRRNFKLKVLIWNLLQIFCKHWSSSLSVAPPFNADATRSSFLIALPVRSLARLGSPLIKLLLTDSPSCAFSVPFTHSPSSLSPLTQHLLASRCLGKQRWCWSKETRCDGKDNLNLRIAIRSKFNWENNIFSSVVHRFAKLRENVVFDCRTVNGAGLKERLSLKRQMEICTRIMIKKKWNKNICEKNHKLWSVWLNIYICLSCSSLIHEKNCLSSGIAI